MNSQFARAMAGPISNATAVNCSKSSADDNRAAAGEAPDRLARFHGRLFSFVFIVHRCLALRSLAATMPHIDPATPRMRRLPADANFEEAEKTQNRKRCREAQARRGHHAAGSPYDGRSARDALLRARHW